MKGFNFEKKSSGLNFGKSERSRVPGSMEIGEREKKI